MEEKIKIYSLNNLDFCHIGNTAYNFNQNLNILPVRRQKKTKIILYSPHVELRADIK